ncbi:programmed cell death protein 2-like isoform X1 [Pteropus vampyrus]|uniref:Programmed cell death protein 2-like isoform X1 n=1 Tax=Pteropus vampyrus TaxID=132908 RepID=A0A6P3QUI6_PTEVA|nr:programmed cell death protein 2-like isoform X2 [Pteropus vampyrus]XP_023393433.1 programmed cell death protein 2-like isoform X1 [Pteropus vampyrus]
MAAVRKPVLLGLPDAAVHGRPTGPGAWSASKLGGLPDALPAVAAPRPVCERCRQLLALVVQVYCPLEGSPFHRLLHVFTCPRPRCGSCGARSWKVFRSQCLQMREKEAPGTQRQENGLAAEDWCEGADDWGSDNEEMSSPQLTLDFGNDSNSAKDLDCTAQLQDLCLQEAVLAAALTVPPGEETALPSVVPQFLPYYICVVDEDDYRDVVSLDHAHNLLREYQQREGIDMEQLISQSLPGDGNEKYEKTTIKSGDKMFYKFKKRIAACQEQILRYSWSGEPLFLTCPTSEVTELPACSHCGAQRTFEFQLMPALVSILRSANLELAKEDQSTKAGRRKEKIKAMAEILRENIKTGEKNIQNQIIWCGFFSFPHIRSDHLKQISLLSPFQFGCLLFFFLA